MSTHGHTTIRNPTGGWSPARPMDRGRRLVLAVTLLAGLFMTAAGVAALLAPTDVLGDPTDPQTPPAFGPSLTGRCRTSDRRSAPSY